MNKKIGTETAKVYLRLEAKEVENYIVFGGYDYINTDFSNKSIYMQKYDSRKSHTLPIRQWLNECGIFEPRVRYNGIYYSNATVFSMPDGYDASNCDWFIKGYQEFDYNLAK